CWFEGLSEQEEEELLPGWIDDCVVFGEIPGSGNYLMMPLSGEKQGRVFEVEHDGFEFIELAPDLEQLLYLGLRPGRRTLSERASRGRGTGDAGPQRQWCRAAVQASRGHRVRARSGGRCSGRGPRRGDRPESALGRAWTLGHFHPARAD